MLSNEEATAVAGVLRASLFNHPASIPDFTQHPHPFFGLALESLEAAFVFARVHSTYKSSVTVAMLQNI
jgi:hypothetical protein